MVNRLGISWSLLLAVAELGCGSYDETTAIDDESETGEIEIGDGEHPTIISVHANDYRTCVVLDRVGVRCWGWGRSSPNEAAIGDDEIPASVDLSVLEVPALDLAFGYGHFCALLEGDRLKCWGTPDFHDEAISFADAEMVEMPGLRQVEIESSFECFVFAEGGVKCRGWGGAELGYGSDENVGDDPDETLSMIPFVDVGDPVKRIAADRSVVCALTEAGAVRCWGYGPSGKLGTGQSGLDTIGDDEAPSSVPPIALPGGPVVQVAVGSDAICALHSTGDVSCWGTAMAQLGYGPAMTAVGYAYGDDEPPNSLGFVPIGGKVTKLAAWRASMCALLDDGSVKCWGSANGSLGYPGVFSVGESNTAADMPPIELGGVAVDIVSGSDHVCAQLESGALRCWGFGSALGYGNREAVGDDEAPAAAGDVPFLR